MATAADAWPVTVGEVRTGLLRNSAAISQSAAEQLLRLVLDEKVRLFERPIPHALSPERLTGVDCYLASSSGARIHVIGTVTSRASITGGHLAQGSAYVQVIAGAAGRRLPWSHYLARPGTVETVGMTTAASVVDGFMAARSGPGILELGAVADRILESVQSDERLDQTAPFKSQRSTLRWLATSDADSDGAATFRLESNLVRTVRLPGHDCDAGSLATLCEDLARHDWLLTTLLTLVARASIGSADRRTVIDRLQPAVDYLLHLWMPAAQIDTALVDFWESIERRPGLTRQWHATVDRIRDQLSLAAVASSHA